MVKPIVIVKILKTVQTIYQYEFTKEDIDSNEWSEKDMKIYSLKEVEKDNSDYSEVILDSSVFLSLQTL